MFDPQIQVFASAEELCQAAAALVAKLSTAPADEENRRLSIALSGGSTPKRMYAILRDTYRSVACNRLEYFFGDVRLVPDSSPDSNFSMAYDSLLSIVDPLHVHQVPIPAVSAPPTTEELPQLAAAVDQFEKDLKSSIPTRGVGGVDVPVFDIVLLGLGPDGHTASLFPGTQAAAETVRLAASCMPNPSVKPFVPRITITQRIIHAAKNVIVLATGADKAWVLREILSGDSSRVASTDRPVACLLRGCTADRGSQVHMLLDQAIAAAGIQPAA